MRERKPARYLAPLAIVAAIMATALVVRSGLATPEHPRTGTPVERASSRRTVPKKRFYVIRAGDTLSSIAAKTGVTVGELQTLNPSVAANPNALQMGQRLRLRP